MSKALFIEAFEEGVMVRHGPFLFALAALLSGCVSAPADRHRIPPHAAPLPDSALMRQCTADLSRLGARFSVLPDAYSGGGCSAINSVLLTGVGAQVTNLRATQCPLARAFAGWVRGPVQQSARDIFGAPIIRIETMGSYSCRQVKGVASTKLSEHAYANAIDISGFVLANGRRITVQTGWNGEGDEADFLRAVRDAACKRFQTVLSPDYNAAHYNHLHVDLGRGPYCR